MPQVSFWFLQRHVMIVLFAVLTLLMITPVEASEKVNAAAYEYDDTDRIKVLHIVADVNFEKPWVKLTTNMSATSADLLDIDLKIVHMPLERETMFQTIRDEIESHDKPDYAIITNNRGEAPAVLHYLNSQNIKTFLVTADLRADDYANIGRPREKFENWIGELIPSDEEAGYRLGKYLIEQARVEKPGKKYALLV